MPSPTIASPGRQLRLMAPDCTSCTSGRRAHLLSQELGRERFEARLRLDLRDRTMSRAGLLLSIARRIAGVGRFQQAVAQIDHRSAPSPKVSPRPARVHDRPCRSPPPGRNVIVHPTIAPLREALADHHVVPKDGAVDACTEPMTERSPMIATCERARRRRCERRFRSSPGRRSARFSPSPRRAARRSSSLRAGETSPGGTAQFGGSARETPMRRVAPRWPPGINRP